MRSCSGWRCSARCRWRSPGTRPAGARTTSPPTAWCCTCWPRRCGSAGWSRCSRTAAAHGPDRATALATAVPRFSRLALVCWLALAVTGVVNAARADPARRAARLRVRRARAGQGGRAARARRARRGTPPVARSAPAARGEPRALLRLGGVEVLLMLATIGLAVALGRSAPPDTGVVSLPHRGDHRLRPRRATDARPAALRLALQPALRHPRRSCWPRSTCSAVRRLRRRGRRLAGRPHGRLAGRLCRTAAGDEFGDRPLRPGDVQRAHGPAHDPRDAGADPAGAGRAGDAGAARPADRLGATGHRGRGSGCWPRCTRRRRAG